MEKEKIRHYLKMIFGSILLPIFFVVYLLDRITLTVYFWHPIEEWSKWVYYPNKVTKSTLRLTVYLAIYGLIELIF